jgi:ankyrin repeat protein
LTESTIVGGGGVISYKLQDIIVACQNGHINIIKLLINKGIDINIKNNDGLAGLYSACKNGHIDIVKLLIDKGADINKMDNY